MKSTQHLIAALSALAVLVASCRQARSAVNRAKEKIKPLPGEEKLKVFLKSDKWWLPTAFRGKIPTAAGEEAKDTKHLVHVARLWELIIFGSIAAMGAEVFDWWIDRFHGGA